MARLIENNRIEILKMISYGDHTSTQAKVCDLLNSKYPESRPGVTLGQQLNMRPFQQFYLSTSFINCAFIKTDNAVITRTVMTSSKIWLQQAMQENDVPELFRQ